MSRDGPPPPAATAPQVARLLPAAALLAAALGWAYAPNLAALEGRWAGDPNYSHGYFVGPLALAILWHRRGRLDPARLAPSPWGWAALLAVLAARAWLYGQNEQWAETATLPAAAAALALALGGWHLLGWALPAIAFLGLLLPLPPSLNTVLAYPLQRLATIVSCALLQALGLPALAEGNIILVGPSQLEVATACNGLSMLLSFVTLITATTLLIEAPAWEKAVLLASAVPIALISNVLRIVVTGWAFYQFGPEAPVWPGWTIRRLTHDPAGWAMMPVALALVWLELRLLGWLIIEEPEEDGLLSLLPGPSPPPRAAPPGERGPGA